MATSSVVLLRLCSSCLIGIDYHIALSPWLCGYARNAIGELRRKYGFDYAVLPVGAGFTLPTILSTSRWKLVDVSALGDDGG